MRFSYESGRSTSSGSRMVPNRYGVPKSRRCLGCNKDMENDGSSLYLRGFCSQKCRETYLYGQ